MNAEGEDDAMLVAYLCGELDEAARLRLEQRLADDPELAARLLELERVDLVGASLRDSAVPTAGATRGARRRLMLMLMVWSVAATAAVIAYQVFGAGSPLAPMRCEVRAVASFAAKGLDGYAEQLGVPPELRYAGTQRGSDRAPGVSADRFLAVAAEREMTRGREALKQPQQPLSDAFFTLRVEVDRECHALVLQLDDDGRWTRRFPARGEPVFGEVTNPLLPGIHTLPRPVVLANDVGTLSVHPGFDASSGRVQPHSWGLLATRERAIEPALMVELDAAATADRSQRLDAWLVARGFTVSPISFERR